jgi:hypothetical protein
LPTGPAIMISLIFMLVVAAFLRRFAGNGSASLLSQKEFSKREMKIDPA